MDLTTRQNNSKPGTMSKQKVAFQICVTQVLFPNITSKKRQMQTQERTVLFHVNSKEDRTCFTMVWIIECRASDITQDLWQGHKSSIEAEKKSHKEGLDLTTRQNNCEPGEKSNKKLAFQLCSTHVLFPNSKSIKRQRQTQERTGHFQVHSKEEWNMFYNGVNNRVQSNRQFTQDLRQWHTTSIEAEKNISQGSIGPYNTPKQQ